MKNAFFTTAILLLGSAAYAAAPAFVATIPLGTTAVSAVAANSITNRVYLVDAANASTVVLDGSTNTTLTSVPSSGIYVAVNSSTNQFVVAAGSTAEVFDGTTNAPLVAIQPPVSLIGNAGFQSMVLNETTNKLYSTTLGSVIMTDLATGVASQLGIPFLKTGEICTVHSLAVNPALNWVYAVTQCQLASAVIFIFDGTSGTILQTVDLGASIPLGADVVECAFNPKSNKFYLANYGGFNLKTQAPIPPSVEVYNGVTLAHLASIPNVVGPLVVDSVLNAVYGKSGINVAGAVIDGSTDTLNSTFALGFSISGVNAMPIGVNEATNMVYYLNEFGGSVSVFQGSLPAPGVFSISGQLSGSGAVGTTINVQGGSNFTAVTDATGAYTVNGVPPGAYGVTPATAGLFYAPTSQSVNITTANVTGVNFAALATPVSVQGLALSPYTMIASGVTTSGTVTLNQVAPAGGIPVSLSSSNAKLVKLPATVTVPSGSSTSVFSIQASGVNTPTTLSITATYSGSLAAAPTSATTTLTVSPNDTLHIQSATWSKSTQLLKVAATSTNSQAILTLFLASGNVNLGTFTNLGGGNFSIQMPFTSGTPASVNVRSNLGGATGQGVTVLP